MSRARWCLLLVLATGTASAGKLELTPFASGLLAPVGLENAGDARMFALEQRGIIKIVRSDGTVDATPFLDISSRVTTSGESGLLGLAFHPDYASNGYFYVRYSHNGSSRNRISRFSVTASPEVADPASEVVLLTLARPTSNHNAGWMGFGPDGYLYIPVGDGGSSSNGQFMGTTLGKLLRIDVDASAGGTPPDCVGTGGTGGYLVPAGNPFVDGPFGPCDEIYGVGFRNPWRASFDRVTGQLWIADVGEVLWEEIDLVGGAGENYGWQCYEGNHPYNTSGCGPASSYTFPVFEYDHGSNRCSVTGGYRYRGVAVPELAGLYVLADYCSGEFWLLEEVAGSWTPSLQDDHGFGYAAFGEDSAGELFVVKRSAGTIERVVWDPCGLAVSPSTLPGGLLGVPYSQTITASHGTPPYTFTVSSGSLPPGLGLDPGTGALSGTPTALGTSSFEVTATDAGCGAGSQGYTLTIACPIEISPTSLPNASVGTSYSQTVTATGGTPPYTYIVTSGTLPAGLSLDSASGIVSGVPIATGSSTFEITASDATTGCVDVEGYTISVSCPTMTLNPTTMPFVLVGVPFSQTITVTGGTAPYTFSAVGTLPTGLSWDPATATISGTATIPNTAHDFDVTATDLYGCSRTKDYNVLTRCPDFVFNPPTLPNAPFGQPYSQTVTASGGTPPYSYAVTSNVLPPGLVLDPSTGAITGTPSAYGNFSFQITATDGYGCTDDRGYSIFVVCAVLTVLPPTLPDGVVGSTYSQTLTPIGGQAPYGLNVASGTLPPGLFLLPSWTISGMPSAQGTSTFTLSVRDAAGCTGSKFYSITIDCPLVDLSPASLPDGAVGMPYSQTISANGGTSPYTFAVTAGSLPPGLSLSTGGAITGSPTSVGTSSFTITATDVQGCEGSLGYTITIGCGVVTLSPAVLPGGTVGVPYSQTVTASGGTAPYTYVVIAGALPPGLTLDAATGAIAGTPTTPGASNFTVEATDAQGCTGSRAYDLTICPAITLSPPTLPGGNVGSPYIQTVTASGGTAPYTYAVTFGGLPAGLSLDAATGAITGTPTAEGTSSFTIAATDAGACTGSHGYDIVIGPADCGTIVITPATLPGGVEGLPYSRALQATGGTPPYVFTVTSGSLPAGITLSSAGTLSGTPTAAGTASFSVTATDALSCTGTQPFGLDVDPAMDVIAGEGLGSNGVNRNGVRAFTRTDVATSVSFQAYAAGSWGTNVSSGNLDTGVYHEILTGPGPGEIFGPQVRAFVRDGSPLQKVNFFAYGTLRYGVNAAGGDLDRDGFDEMLSGPGPGEVFGPHVRGWSYDGTGLTTIAKINFFAYATLKYGVNVEEGDVDGDGYAEILTGPGPGIVFSANVRGWNYDGASVTSIGKINFVPFASLSYGVNVAGGDLDGDGTAGIAVTPGPGPGAAYVSQFLGYDYGPPLAPLPGYDVTPFATLYGGRVNAADVDADGSSDLLAGAGRDPVADSTVRRYRYAAGALTPAGSFVPFAAAGYGYGVNVTGGGLGYYP